MLVDAGVGDLLGPKLGGIYRVGEDGATLEGALAAAGLAPADITDVVLTHLHFDHGGGALRREGERRVPRLPRARYYVQRRNWENALQPNPRERASYLADLFLPLEQAGVVTLWDGAATPWPGFEIFTAEGHTRGQQLAWIAGGGTALAFVADLIPTASHVRIPFVMGYDVAAIETMEEKRRLLERAVAEGAWICLEHDPEIPLARPLPQGDDFGWGETIVASGSAANERTTGSASPGVPRH